MTLASINKLFLRSRSGQPYHNLIQQLDVALFLVEPKTGKILDTNHKAIELTGYARQHLLDLDLAGLIDQRRENGQQALEALHSLEAETFRRMQNVPLVGYGGRQRLADLRISWADSEEGDPVVLILAYDAESRANRARQENERKQSLEAIDDLSRLLIAPDSASMDEVAQISRTLLLASATGIYQVSALPAREFRLQAGAGLPASFPADLPAKDAHWLQQPQTWRMGEPATTTLTCAAQAAEWTAAYIHPLGNALSMFGVLVAGYQGQHPTDIMLLLRLNAQLLSGILNAQLNTQQADNNQQHAETLTTQFNTILGNLDEAIVITDHNGNVVSLNPAAESLLGYSTVEAANLPLSEVLVTPRSMVSHLLNPQTGHRTNKQDLTLIRRDGETRAVWLWACSLPHPSDDCAPTGMAIIIADRTEHRDLIAQSTHLEQRAFLGDLSAIFAHEVRNPLNGISTGLQYLAAVSPPNDPVQQSLSEIQAEADRIEHLLRDILLVAKPAERETRPHDLGKLIERILGRWQAHMTRYKIQSICNVAADTPMVMIDLRQIDQVFTNLITNATDAMTETGGILTIHIKPLKTERGTYVQVMVADTGAGIPETKQEQVFKPFFTTKAQGTGLGLAISQHFINNNKGTISVQSWPGIGTVFEVLLPAVATGGDE